MARRRNNTGDGMFEGMSSLPPAEPPPPLFPDPPAQGHGEAGRGAADLTQRHLFDGADIDPDRDNGRLYSQLSRIKELMGDGGWRTLAEISGVTGDPPASVSAQLRNLRKKRFGSHTVERRHVGNGLYEYRLVTGCTPEVCE